MSNQDDHDDTQGFCTCIEKIKSNSSLLFKEGFERETILFLVKISFEVYLNAYLETKTSEKLSMYLIFSKIFIIFF